MTQVHSLIRTLQSLENEVYILTSALACEGWRLTDARRLRERQIYRFFCHVLGPAPEFSVEGHTLPDPEEWIVTKVAREGFTLTGPGGARCDVRGWGEAVLQLLRSDWMAYRVEQAVNRRCVADSDKNLKE